MIHSSPHIPTIPVTIICIQYRPQRQVSWFSFTYMLSSRGLLERQLLVSSIYTDIIYHHIQLAKTFQIIRVGSHNYTFWMHHWYKGLGNLYTLYYHIKLDKTLQLGIICTPQYMRIKQNTIYNYHMQLMVAVLVRSNHTYLQLGSHYSMWHIGLRHQSDNPKVVDQSPAGGEKLSVV